MRRETMSTSTEKKLNESVSCGCQGLPYSKLSRAKPPSYHVALLLAPVGLFIILNLAVIRGRRDASHMIENLKPYPTSGSIYFLGNSMFKTGIDFEHIGQTVASNQKVLFGYYDGHYSGLWYLIAENVLTQLEEPPRIVVWGFRPTYAMTPAFRKRNVCSIERFLRKQEPVYDAISGGRYMGWDDRVAIRLTESVPLLAKRWEIRKALSGMMVRTGADAFAHLAGRPDMRETGKAVASGSISLADVLVQRLSRGEAQMAEETVDDRGQAFVTGPPMSFARSFVPCTATLLRRAGISQLVLIFKPRCFADGNGSSQARAFAADAVAFFEEEGIPCINFADSAEPDIRHYARGDHYNAGGRALLTKRIAAALNQVLLKARSSEASEESTPL